MTACDRRDVSMAAALVLSLLATLLGPVVSSSAKVGEVAVGPADVAEAEGTRGCRPPTPDPTPTPTPTAAPARTTAPAVAGGSSTGPAAVPAATPAPTPTPYLPPGIDVSRWTGTIPYAPVRDHGVRFVIIKATQGISGSDPLFETHLGRARRQGLLVGAYHFFDYRADGRAQADHFVDVVAAAGATADALPLAIDVECLASYGWSEHAVAAPALRALVDRVYERTGRLPIMYTSRHMWDQVTGGDPTFGELPLWVACWRCDRPLLPTGWKGWRFWQYGPMSIPGLTDKVDGNVFRGTDTTLERWRNAALLVNDGARFTNDPQVRVNLARLDGSDVRSASDAGDWSPWAPATMVLQHLLGVGDGERTVRVQLRTEAGVEGPVLSDGIVLDTASPWIAEPQLDLRRGTLGTGPAVPVMVTWSASDGTSGVADTGLAHDCGDGLDTERSVAGASPARRIAAEVLASVTGEIPTGTCHLQASATDGAGNGARSVDGAGVRLRLLSDSASLIVAYGPSWTRAAQAGALGGHVMTARAPGARVTFTVSGTDMAVVSTLGRNRGRARVLVDGREAATVDLYAPGRAVRRVVFTTTLDGPGPHTVSLVALRAANPASRGTRVDIDGVVVVSRALPPTG